MVRETTLGMVAWGRSKLNIFFFFEVIERFSLLYRPRAKSQWITNQWEEIKQREKDDPGEKGATGPLVQMKNYFGKRPTVFREKRLGVATVFPWFGSSSPVWMVYLDIAGMFLGLFLIFDICLCHHCQSNSLKTLEPLVFQWRVKSELPARMALSPQPASAFPTCTPPPFLPYPPRPPLAVPTCTWSTDTNPVLSFPTSAFIHASSPRASFSSPLHLLILLIFQNCINAPSWEKLYFSLPLFPVRMFLLFLNCPL